MESTSMNIKVEINYKLGIIEISCMYLYLVIYLCVFIFIFSDLLVRLVSVDLHTFGPEALMAIKLIEHQSTNSQVAEVRPQLVENVPPPVQGAPAAGKSL